METVDLPAVINEYISTQNIRKSTELQARKERRHEDDLYEFIIGELENRRAQGSNDLSEKGDTVEVELAYKVKAKAKDWDAIHKWVLEQQRLDALHKRLTESVVKAIWEGGGDIPGVDAESVPYLEVTHIK